MAIMPSCSCKFNVPPARLCVFFGGGVKYCARMGGLLSFFPQRVIGALNMSRFTHCAASLYSASGGMNCLIQGFTTASWGLLPPKSTASDIAGAARDFQALGE